MLSDGPVPTLGNVCSAGGGHRGQCLLGGCYTAVERCDGKADCQDRVDEKGCKLCCVLLWFLLFVGFFQCFICLVFLK